jgi:hypothetical protein
MLDLAGSVGSEIATRLVENALEDAVSTMDGFGREICKIYAMLASDPSKVQNVSFQSIEGARNQILSEYQIDISSAIGPVNWNALVRSFQKRHLLAHRMGVIDQRYLDVTGEDSRLLGRKVKIENSEVAEMLNSLSEVGNYLSSEFEAKS